MTGKTKRIQEDRKTRCHGEHRGEPTEKTKQKAWRNKLGTHDRPAEKKNEKGKSGGEELSGNT